MSGGSFGQNRDGAPDGEIGVKTRTRVGRPSLYKVLMLNDDFTPMDFVTHVLQAYFGKSQDEAMELMLQVHQRGVAVCGVYTLDVAETKVTQVIELARKHQHPLQCVLEKE